MKLLKITFKRYITFPLSILILSFFCIGIANAGPKSTAKANLKQIKRAQKRIKRNKLSAAQISQLKIATTMVDSDSDGVPDVVENAKSGHDACDPDSDGDGVLDGDESSSSSSGSSSSSSGDSSSSSGSSSSSSGSSSSGDDDDDSSSGG